MKCERSQPSVGSTRKQDSGSTTMKPTGLHVWLVAEAPSLFDPDLLAMYAALLALIVGGGIVIYGTYRWYRTLKNASSSRNDDLDELARAMEDEAELAPEERERIRAALERQRQVDVQQPSD
jgi:hypothetical protein